MQQTHHEVIDNKRRKRNNYIKCSANWVFCTFSVRLKTLLPFVSKQIIKLSTERTVNLFNLSCSHLFFFFRLNEHFCCVLFDSIPPTVLNVSIFEMVFLLGVFQYWKRDLWRKKNLLFLRIIYGKITVFDVNSKYINMKHTSCFAHQIGCSFNTYGQLQTANRFH